MNKSSINSIAQSLVNAINPLRGIFSDDTLFKNFLLKLGWNAQNRPSIYSSLVSTIENIVDDLENIPENAPITDYLSLIDDVGILYNTLKNLDANSANAPSGTDATLFLSEFATQTFDYLIVRYLNENLPILYNSLKLFNIIDIDYAESAGVRLGYYKTSIDYSKFSNLITSPEDHIKAALGWNTGDVPFSEITNTFFNFFSALHLGVISESIDGSEKLLYQSAFNNDDVIDKKLSLYLLTLEIANQTENIILNFLASKGSTIANSGYIVGIELPADLSLSQQITDSISLDINLASLSGNELAVLMKPSGIIFNFPNNTTQQFPDIGIDLNVNYKSDQPNLILGNISGTRLLLSYASIGIEISHIDTDPEIIFTFDLSGLSLIINPGESDSFISKIFGDSPKEIVLPLTIRWSSKTGISFSGSGSFEYSVPTHTQLGPITFEEATVSLKALDNPSRVKADISTSFNGTVGPLTFTVNKLGIRAQLDLEEGNVGPFGISLGFKPPTGIGIAIDAKPVKGGGFLNYDEATYTYTGGLELTFSKISLKAIGILTTKLPGGADGYSLLIIITAEFTPIQLGMGFTLNGVGGLLGLNRTMNQQRLRDGVRDGTLDDILFPQDIVKNANAIISNISQAFPAQQDRFIIGPMAKIGWGTPTLLTIELGVMIEMPSPIVLAILGVIRAILPNDKNRIIAIQINFIGIIDFEKKYLTIDASLYDSQILTFKLFGDMALRLYWGDKPNFLMSVGGFHPKYTPPPIMNLPPMKRLSIVLANSDNLKISVETYFAVSSNSVQFGAKVAALARVWKIEAVGALWFDILFQFSPFYFIADMGVMFAIRWKKGGEIFGIYVQLTLEGPKPWHARGKASFKVVGFRVNVSFDATFGQANVEAIPAVDIWPQLEEAIKHKDNWEAAAPEYSHHLVTYKEVPLDDEEILMDPFGMVRVTQKVVPFNIDITKFGTSGIKDYKRFGISGAQTNNTPFTPTPYTQEFFARNEFFYMTDDQKLSSDAYEKFVNGITIGAPDGISSDYIVNKQVGFEEIIVDINRNRLSILEYMTDIEFDMNTAANYVSNSTLSTFALQPVEGGPKKSLVSHEGFVVDAGGNLLQGGFVLVDGLTLTPVNTDIFSNLNSAETELENLRLNNPAAAEYLILSTLEL